MDERIVASVPPLPEWAVETPPPAVGADPKGMPSLPSWAKEEFPPAQEPSLPAWAKETPVSQEPLVAEKPDQATIDRMRQVEQPEKQSFLKTLGQETIDKLGGLGETILSAGSAVAGFPLGVASGAGKLAYDIWKGGGQGVDVPAAKEFGEKVTEKAIYQPKTSFGQSTTQALAAPFTVAQEGIRAGAKAITDDPQAQAAIGLAGDAALAFLIPKLAKLTRDAGTAVSTKIYEDSIRQVVKKGLETKHSPEVMKVVENAIRENVTPGTILEEVKRNVGTRRAEVKEAMPKLAEPIEAKAPEIRAPEPPAPTVAAPEAVGEYVKHKATGTVFRVVDNRNPSSVTVDYSGKPMVLDRRHIEPVAEVAQTPAPVPEIRPTVTVEPKIEAGGYTPTGEIIPPQEGSRLRGIAEDKARWEREHEGTRKYGSLQTFMEMPIEETKASADYGVAEAKQALAARVEAGETVPATETKSVVPKAPSEIVYPARAKPRSSARGGQGLSPEEMTPFERWQYNNKMGIPNPPPRPKGKGRRGPTEAEYYQKMAADDAVARIEDGKTNWNELAPEEQAVVEQYIAPERVAEFKAMANVEVVPPFTKEMAEAKDAEIKAKRDRVQGLPEKLAVSPEWKPEWDALILPALDKTKIKPEHRAEATLLLKHGFSMKKVQGTDVAKGMEHYLNTLKTRLKADERFPETQMPEVKTAEGTIEIEPTAEMAKGEPAPKGKNIIVEPGEAEVAAKRKNRILEEVSKIMDDYESSKITDPKEKAMFRVVVREGFSGKEAESELAKRGIKVTDDTLRKREKKWKADLQEHGQARKESIQKLMDELVGNEFDKATTELADKMDKDLGPVKGPKVGLTVEMAHPIPEITRGGEKFKFPEGTEARYEASKSLVKPTVIQKVNDFLTEAYHGMTRVYQDLPRGPEWVEVTQTLKNNEKQPGIISDKLNRTYKSMYYKLNRDSYDLATRKAIVADLLHEADAGRELPFGFNEKSLRDVSKKLDEFTKDNAPVNDALKNRTDVWEGIRKEYIYWREKAGHDVEDILTKPDYFRHKVLETARSEYNKVGPGKKLRLRTGQDFLKKRGGSEKDILSDLVSADYEVMSRMLRDIADAKALVKIRGVADKSAQFRAEAKRRDVPIEEVIPDEYTKWQPKEGHLMYVADTLPAKIAEKIMTDELNDIGVVKDKLRKSLAMGRERETWIIKKELAATLDKLGAQKEAKVMGGLFKTALTAWKKWTLLSHRRAIKYNLRNATGDADHVFVGSPGVFLKAPQSIKELWPAFVGDRPLTGNLRDFAERGGFQSTLQIQDIGEIKKLPAYRNLYKPNVLNDINLFKKYWRFVNNATNYREGILRYAAYLKYLEDMQKDPNGRPKNFGASFPEEIMALSDIKDRAFRLSNELLGPYDEVSPVGVEISSKIFPFWRWKEVNAKFYARVVKNIANNDEAAARTARSVLGGARIAASVGTRTLIGAGRFALKAMGLTALLTAWNNLVMEDEEKDLPEDVRNRLHLVLGRDKGGQPIAFTRLGALGDMLEWFGMDNAYGHMTDYLNGRKTMKEIVADMVKSPVNIVAGGISPFIKAPLEVLMRRTLFPDAFDPKVIRDRGIFLARQVGLEEEYKAIAGKPGKPYLSTISQMAVYKYDPLESAYYDFLDIKRSYFKSIGRGGGGAYLSPSSNALYNMKQALRWGEHKLVDKYMDEYVSIVAMQHPDAEPEERKKLVVKGIQQSLDSLHPLWGIKQDDWPDYVKSLDPEAKDTLSKALRFYSEVLLGKSDVKEND